MTDPWEEEADAAGAVYVRAIPQDKAKAFLAILRDRTKPENEAFLSDFIARCADGIEHACGAMDKQMLMANLATQEWRTTYLDELQRDLEMELERRKERNERS